MSNVHVYYNNNYAGDSLESEYLIYSELCASTKRFYDETVLSVMKKIQGSAQNQYSDHYPFWIWRKMGYFLFTKAQKKTKADSVLGICTLLAERFFDLF